MLTKVILEGAFGKAVGRVWNLAVNTPQEALRMIDANVDSDKSPFAWIRNNLEKYASYKVICESENGNVAELDEEEYRSGVMGKLKSIRFVPLITGSGDVGKIVLGIVIAVVAWFLPPAYAFLAPAMYSMAASLIIGGIVGLLTSKPTQSGNSEEGKKESYYFDGPANTTEQGVPVPLIYGRVLTGSHAISASITVDLMDTPPAAPLPSEYTFWTGRSSSGSGFASVT